MRMCLTKEKVTAEEAILINQQMINITRCHGQLTASNEKAWNKSDFFNTIDRLETLYLFGNYLMSLTYREGTPPAPDANNSDDTNSDADENVQALQENDDTHQEGLYYE